MYRNRYVFLPPEESFRKKLLEYPSENRRPQEIGSSSGTSGLASASSKADSWEKSQIKKIRLRSKFILSY